MFAPMTYAQLFAFVARTPIGIYHGLDSGWGGNMVLLRYQTQSINSSSKPVHLPALSTILITDQGLSIQVQYIGKICTWQDNRPKRNTRNTATVSGRTRDPPHLKAVKLRLGRRDPCRAFRVGVARRWAVLEENFVVDHFDAAAAAGSWVPAKV